MGVALSLLLVFSLVLIGAPIALNVTHHPLNALSASIMIGAGITLALICATLLTITKLYVKTRANEAFVRTGMGGLKVIRDGGAIVLPVIHQIVRVTLETIRLEVSRNGADAMITSDKLRADIKAEFFVRVQPEDESIQAAARSIGDREEKDAIRKLIEDKLVSALRTAAARKTLEQLNSSRDEFLKEVMDSVSNDLKHNGFTLETVTISKLDQTDVVHLKQDNIFDAQGMRTIAEITQKNKTEKNAIEQAGLQARTAQDVEARQNVLNLERTKAEAEAQQHAQIAVIQAEQGRIEKEKQIDAARAVEIAQVEQQKQIEVARRSQAQAIEVAEKDKIRKVVEADQQVEVARRAQQKAVAEAEAEKAVAEAKLAEAEAERQNARQKIITVEQIATADREKEKAIIAATAEAQRQYVATEKAADAEAYKTKTQADARKASADADAEAMRKKAHAEADAVKSKAEGEKAAALAQAEAEKAKLLASAEGQKAKLLAEAEGQRAVAMVPVDVKAKQVEVDQRYVETVLKPELEARERSGEVAQNFELAKLRVVKEAEVRIEGAKAYISIVGKVQANVYGTPEDVARMADGFAKGMGLANTVAGFLAGADDDTKSVAAKALNAAADLTAAASARLGGEKPASAADAE